MIIGVPKEIKTEEYRVSLTPAGARRLALAGHEVVVEKGAGEGSGIADTEYEAAGARVVDTAEEAWLAEIVAKVKEPLPSEFVYLRNDLTVYTFLHLAAAPELAKKLMETGCLAIGYETVTDPHAGGLPILAPMSEIAGRMAVQAGAKYLEKEHGGRGVLLGGVPGVKPGVVVILGAGVVGSNAAKIAVGFGADVTILDTNLNRLRYIDDVFHGRIKTVHSTGDAVREAVPDADLVIGAVLVAGDRTPWLVTRDMLPGMKTGSVIVDVSVDQGGCVETSRPTTHANPVFTVDGVTHYCVANMPGAVPRTSTFALASVTFGYLFEMAQKGARRALDENPGLREGVNVADGFIAYRKVADALELAYRAMM